MIRVSRVFYRSGEQSLRTGSGRTDVRLVKSHRGVWHLSRWSSSEVNHNWQSNKTRKKRVQERFPKRLYTERIEVCPAYGKSEIDKIEKSSASNGKTAIGKKEG